MGHNIWGGCCRGGFWGMSGMGAWSPLLGLLFSVVLIIGVAWLMIWLIRRATETGSRMGEGSGGSIRRENALDILKKRFARGEINRAEYQEMKKDLGG